MHIVIFGAGAIGCFVGGTLIATSKRPQATKQRVSFLGRAKIITPMNIKGMSLSDYLGWHVDLYPDQFSAHVTPDRLAESDLIILTTKATALDEVIDTLKAHAPIKTPIISLMNGISPVAHLKQKLPDHEIIRGAVAYNIARMPTSSDGFVHWHKGSIGEIFVERTSITENLAAQTETHAGAWRVVDNMEAVAWGKLLLNLNNPINALSGETLKRELMDRDFRNILYQAMGETLALLAQAGIKPAKIGTLPPKAMKVMVGLPNFLFNTIALKIQKIDDKARSSMADDFAADRPTEIDFLNGEVVALAKRLGTQAPINENLVTLVKAAESGGRKQWSGRALAEAVLSKT